MGQTFPMLSALTFLPFVGGLFVLGLSGDAKKLPRLTAFGVTLLTLAGALVLASTFNSRSGGLQFEEWHEWIPVLAVQYHAALDGISLIFVLLTALMFPLAVLAAWQLQDRAHLYFGLVLLLESGLLGTFTALNFFHWFLFWELSLVPAFFLIRLWGGPSRTQAATRFFIYSMVGSIGLLLGFLAVALAARSFDFVELAKMAGDGSLNTALTSATFGGLSSGTLMLLAFLGVTLGFAVKTPIMPFHSWLPLAYAEAPTGTVMLLTGLMSKMGIYGFVRILLPIFPNQTQAMLTPLLWLAVASIVISAGAAFAQNDLKRMLAFSSINHLGYCLLGLFAVLRPDGMGASAELNRVAALNGVLLQVFNHGITAATLFWFLGLLERRTGLRRLDAFGGLRRVAPVFCGLMGIALFSSLGLPGLNGFVSEFLIFKGAFPLVTWAASLSVLGLLITAIFILTLLQRVFNGPLNPRWAQFPDLTGTERLMLSPPLLLMLLLGLWPQLIIGLSNRSVMQMVAALKL